MGDRLPGLLLGDTVLLTIRFVILDSLWVTC